MSTPSYMAGSLITSTATFVSTETGENSDPTTVVVKVKQEGTTSSYTYPNAFITKVSTGVYSCEIDTTSNAGPGTVEWIGTGAVQAINATSWFTTAAPL
jgi:hypothetical protein